MWAGGGQINRSLGWFIGAIGVKYHMLVLLFVGNGIIGGFGVGAGYTSPVSTLMKVREIRRDEVVVAVVVMVFG